MEESVGAFGGRKHGMRVGANTVQTLSHFVVEAGAHISLEDAQLQLFGRHLPTKQHTARRLR
eukprot:6180838-Pleurochrysis_carterae.AAC.2